MLENGNLQINSQYGKIYTLTVHRFTGEKQKRRRCFLQSGHEHWSTGLNFYTKRDKLLDLITYITQRYKHQPKVRNTTNETYKHSLVINT